MNHSVWFVFILFIFTIQVQSKRLIMPKDLESFCHYYPLHRRCMGAFAGGGKRTFSMDEPDSDDIELNLKQIIKKYKENLLRKLIVLKELEQLYKLISDDPNNQNVNDYGEDDDDDSIEAIEENMSPTNNNNNNKNSKTQSSLAQQSNNKSKLIELLKKLDEQDSNN